MIPPPEPLQGDPVLRALCEIASSAGYRVESGVREFYEPSIQGGVCAYSKRLIQLHSALGPLASMAQFVLLHELAHAILHDGYEDDGGATRATHEAEANTVRKLVWPFLNGYKFHFEDTLAEPTVRVVEVANRILARFGRVLPTRTDTSDSLGRRPGGWGLREGRARPIRPRTEPIGGRAAQR